MNETACATVNQIVEWLKVKGADAALNVLLQNTLEEVSTWPSS